VPIPFLSKLAIHVILLSGLFAALPGTAQPTRPFPGKAITIVVPFPPGGSSDKAVRMIGQKLSSNIGQPVVIDNKPGGGGFIGAMAVKQAAPDGYTLFMGHAATHAINVALYDSLPYDPVKDFAPITTFMTFPSILVVPSALPAKSVPDLIALARSKPGGLSYSSQGIGTPGHLLGAMMQTKTNAPLVHIPMKGAAAAVTEVVAGRVDFLFSSYITAGAFVRDGRLRMLAIASAQRAPALPDLPTMAESGLPGVDDDYWFGFFAPAHTPEDVIRRLHQELTKAARTPEMKEFLESQAAGVITNTPEEFRTLIRNDIVRWRKIVRDAGAKAE